MVCCVSDTWSTVKEAFNIDALSQFDGSKMLAAGEMLVGKLKEGVTGGGWDGMVANIWTRFNDLISWFNNEGAEQFRESGESMVASFDEGMRAIYEGGTNPISDMVAAAKQSARQYEGAALRTVQTLAEVASEADDLGEKEVEINVTAAVSALDVVADKLAAIARTFKAIGAAFPDMTSVPVPAAAIGAIVPAATRVTDDSRGRGGQIDVLLERLITRIEELEEAVADRPIHLESRVVLEQREIGRATADYNAGNSRITNGNGGGNRW